MRLKLVPVLAALAVCLAAPAAAPAALKVGMSENNPQMFADPNYLALGAKITRIVVSYNAPEAAARGDDELTVRVAPYLRAATDLGIDTLVTFEHARGNAEICKNRANRLLPQCRLPSNAEYERNIRQFLTLFPMVRTIAAWNEANHNTQPTYKDARKAAGFAKIAERVCRELRRKCKVVVLDLLDQADNVKAKRPTFKSLARYVKTFRRAYGKKPGICGMHTYSDVNRFRDAGTKAMMKALKCKKYWLTETGGLYNFASFWSAKMRRQFKCRNAAACQLKATKFMFRLLKRNRRIERAYIHAYYGSHAPRFDAGLVTGGPGQATTPRPAYREVKKHT